MMGSLPTCWYCPKCGDGPAPRGFKHLRGDDGGDTICPGTHVKCVVIPPGTPLTVILDTLGIPHLLRDEPAMNAAELYAAMCRFAEDHGYRRRSPDEGGWWDHEEECRGDMTIGELVEEEFMRQKIDMRIAPKGDA